MSESWRPTDATFLAVDGIFTPDESVKEVKLMSPPTVITIPKDAMVLRFPTSSVTGSQEKLPVPNQKVVTWFRGGAGCQAATGFGAGREFIMDASTLYVRLAWMDVLPNLKRQNGFMQRKGSKLHWFLQKVPCDPLTFKWLETRMGEILGLGHGPVVHPPEAI